MTKTILITGATDGIGLETAKLLSADGHDLILHGRNAEKLESATGEMKGGGSVETVTADFAKLDEVQGMAEDLRARLDRLDVLINNAGVFKTADPITESGLDVRFVVNAFAPYLLTKALLPVMGADGRVVNLSSAAQSPVDIDAMAGKRRLGDMDAYAQSKLALTAWSRVLADAHPNGPVIVAVNPGSMLASKMVRDGFGVAGNDLSIGAEILRKAAADEVFAGASGQYFDNDAGRFANPHPDAANSATAKNITDAIDRILGGLAAA